MKTNQEMVRYIDSFSVVQRTSDGYFDGTELLRQWNNVEGNPRRQMSKGGFYQFHFLFLA